MKLAMVSGYKKYVVTKYYRLVEAISESNPIFVQIEIVYFSWQSLEH